MQNEQLKKMMNGAIVLSAASFLTKLLSAVYKIPFQNLTGDEGFYVYQQVYPIYGIAAALALNGLPVFVSKVTAELASFEERKQLLKRLTVLITAGAAGLFFVLWFGAPTVAGWMGDQGLASLIRSVSLVYLLIPLLAASRGYFQGTLNMLPTGVSQVGEQVVRVGVILLAAVWYTRSSWSVYQMGTAAMSASWLAGVAAVLILSYYVYKETRQQSSARVVRVVKQASFRNLLKRLLTEGMVISAFSSLLILLQLVDSFTVYNGLLDSGIDENSAMMMKGVYDRGQPMVQLGMVVGTAFASSLLPLLSEQRAQKREAGFIRTASSVLRITAVFASAATIGLIVLMPQFNRTLFSDTAGTSVLRVYVIGIFAASLIGAYNAVLQSMNKQGPAITGLAAGLLVKALFNRHMVGMFGTIGASLTTVAALFVVLFVLWLYAPGPLKKAVLNSSFLWKLFLALASMSAVVSLVVWTVEGWLPGDGRGTALLVALSGVAVGAVIYGIIVLKTHIFTIREWLSLPFGRKVLKKGQ